MLKTLLHSPSSCLLASYTLLIALVIPVRSQVPGGFVYLSDTEPTVVQDIRYYGIHNFVGRRIEGYQAPECILTRQAALSLARVQAELAKDNLSLVVWDCYRPARAVADFLRWSKNTVDGRMKAEFYPNTGKSSLFASGYLAMRSAHSRGSTVDVGLTSKGSVIPAFDPAAPLFPCTAPKGVRFEDGAIDFGTGYDCLDPRASTAFPIVPQIAQKNRWRLRALMVTFGFKPYDKEWWHFELAREPFPKQVFDFAIEPKPH